MSERMCLITKEPLPTQELIRFVKDPHGRLLPDILNKLPGRGVWVKTNKHLVLEAIRKKLFAKSLKSTVVVEETLAELTQSLLYKHALEGLGLANKAGVVSFGFDACHKLLATGKAGALIHAVETAKDGKGKLNALAQKSANVAVIEDVFQGEDLDALFNRSNSMHICVQRNNIADVFVKRVERYKAYIGQGDKE